MGNEDGNEFEKYKYQVKKSIRKFVTEQQYDLANELISEYEAIVGSNDIEVLSIQANIAFFCGKMDKAESLCKEILNKNSAHVDSLYNLAYIFQNKGYWEGALYFYRRALEEYKNEKGREGLEREISAVTLELDLLNQKRSVKQDNVCVSIVLLAYNQLEYTKLCVDSFYKYTSHFNFELITVDNGSSDETEIYFKWLPNLKKIVFKENQGCIKAINQAFNQAQGKYLVFISNDLVFTENWLDNLITCIESDEKIGMVVPACSFSSANQQVNLNYGNLEEMYCFAKQFNASNANKWEERIRLITYMFLMRAETYFQYGWKEPIYLQGGFDDDDLSFSVRRAGYKLIFARDTFIHHFGSKTITNDYRKYNLLERNRKVFFNKFGVDAWDDTGFNPELFNILKLSDEASQIKILEIGNYCGGNAIHLKNILREKGIFDVEINYLTENERFCVDLKTMGKLVYCAPFNQVGQLFQRKKFDFILISGELEKMIACEKEMNSFLSQIGSLMHSETQAAFYVTNPAYYMQLVASVSRGSNLEGKDAVWQNVAKDRFDEKLYRLGFDEIYSYNLTVGVSGQQQEVCDDVGALFQKYFPDCDKEKFKICKFLYVVKGFHPKKSFLVYPGYDAWLNNVLLFDKSIGNFLGVDPGETAIGLMKKELYNKGYCLDTIDQVPLYEADYVMYFDAPKSFDNPIFSLMYHQVYKGQYFFDQLNKQEQRPKMILLLHESPLIMPENYRNDIHEKFDYIFTWCDDLVDNTKYFKMQFSQPEKVDNPFIQSFKKKKLCTMVAGNKRSQEEGELYSQRLNTIQFFEEKYSGKFAFYGAGWPEGVYRNYKGAIDRKLSVMSQYRFAICYENNVMNGYITEKIFDCFFARCVPVYWGAPNITDFIPANTFIARQQFTTHEEMYQYLNEMTEKEYQKYIDNIEGFLNSEQYKQFTHETFVRNILRTIKL